MNWILWVLAAISAVLIVLGFKKGCIGFFFLSSVISTFALDMDGRFEKWMILCPLAIFVIWGLAGQFIFRKWGVYRRFACKQGWHSYPDFDVTGHDGCSAHAKCKWCGYEGMIDSQGNLF